jgi:hypothetical protein
VRTNPTLYCHRQGAYSPKGQPPEVENGRNQYSRTLELVIEWESLRCVRLSSASCGRNNRVGR